MKVCITTRESLNHVTDNTADFYANNQQDATCRLIYSSLSALHVSDDIFARHQGHLTVFTASGNIHQCLCRLVPWRIWNCDVVPTPPWHQNK